MLASTFTNYTIGINLPMQIFPLCRQYSHYISQEKKSAVLILFDLNNILFNHLGSHLNYANSANRCKITKNIPNHQLFESVFD